MSEGREVHNDNDDGAASVTKLLTIKDLITLGAMLVAGAIAFGELRGDIRALEDQVQTVERDRALVSDSRVARIEEKMLYIMESNQRVERTIEQIKQELKAANREP